MASAARLQNLDNDYAQGDVLNPGLMQRVSFEHMPSLQKMQTY